MSELMGERRENRTMCGDVQVVVGGSRDLPTEIFLLSVDRAEDPLVAPVWRVLDDGSPTAYDPLSDLTYAARARVATGDALMACVVVVVSDHDYPSECRTAVVAAVEGRDEYKRPGRPCATIPGRREMWDCLRRHVRMAPRTETATPTGADDAA